MSNVWWGVRCGNKLLYCTFRSAGNHDSNLDLGTALCFMLLALMLV